MTTLLQAIGIEKLTEYFEYLDELRDSGATNMWGAPAYLLREYRGMTKQEAKAVLFSWMHTFSNSLPIEDRVDQALQEDQKK